MQLSLVTLPVEDTEDLRSSADGTRDNFISLFTLFLSDSPPLATKAEYKEWGWGVSSSELIGHTSLLEHALPFLTPTFSTVSALLLPQDSL